jgi:hypothetical protein
MPDRIVTFMSRCVAIAERQLIPGRKPEFRRQSALGIIP